MDDPCDKALEIIRATRDGDSLSPIDLKLVEVVVNGLASETGLEAFDKLHRDVLAGTYKPPWLHGLEHMTFDHDGHVRWKDVKVEHFEPGFAYTDKGRQSARLVALRCKFLESQNETVSLHSVISTWDEKHRSGYLKMCGVVWKTGQSEGAAMLVREHPQAVFGRVLYQPLPTSSVKYEIATFPSRTSRTSIEGVSFVRQVPVADILTARADIEDSAEEWIAKHTGSL